jgi:hypothetical protein
MSSDIVDEFVEIRLKSEDSFLKIKETLTRIGIASKHKRELYQSCHILHKKGKYYIVHFKELFKLDGKPSNFDDVDLARRNTIVDLLKGWDLLDVVDESKIKDPKAPLNQIKVLKHIEKSEWTLIPKHSIGNRRS